LEVVGGCSFGVRFASLVDAQCHVFVDPSLSLSTCFSPRSPSLQANKTFLFQQTKALLNEKSLLAFMEEKIKSLGTAACPPYHLSIVVGGLSAEQNLKTVKMASTRYYDNLHTSGNEDGRVRALRVFLSPLNADSMVGASDRTRLLFCCLLSP
jgi:hypothetical protein